MSEALDQDGEARGDLDAPTVTAPRPRLRPAMPFPLLPRLLAGERIAAIGSLVPELPLSPAPPVLATADLAWSTMDDFRDEGGDTSADDCSLVREPSATAASGTSTGAPPEVDTPPLELPKLSELPKPSELSELPELTAQLAAEVAGSKPDQDAAFHAEPVVDGTGPNRAKLHTQGAPADEPPSYASEPSPPKPPSADAVRSAPLPISTPLSILPSVDLPSERPVEHVRAEEPAIDIASAGPLPPVLPPRPGPSFPASQRPSFASQGVAGSPAEAEVDLYRRQSLRSGFRLFGRIVRYCAIAFVVWFIAMIGLIALFRFVDPPASALMLIRAASGYSIERQHVPLSRIAPQLRRAVVASEDGKFCSHRGFDFGEIRAALKAGDGFGRGASTISQQLAKNLFLWPDRSYVRKALEVPLTVAIEWTWPKWRILEVYLNVVEWGPGLYGAEVAAQSYFGKPASRLSEREAALLAVALPNPLARDASDPEPMQARLASRLQTRMRAGARYPCIFPDQGRDGVNDGS